MHINQIMEVLIVQYVRIPLNLTNSTICAYTISEFDYLHYLCLYNIKSD